MRPETITGSLASPTARLRGGPRDEEPPADVGISALAREDMPRVSDASGLPPPSSSTPRSLVLASLDIGRVLADHDGVTFRAQGTCMFPTIRPGDVLRIQSRPADQVSVGEIAVCRRPKYLFAHRVIETGCEKGRAYIVTRPDTTRDGSDGASFDDDLLGVVVAIKRHGKSMPLEPQTSKGLLRILLALRRGLIKAARRAHLWWDRILAGLQSRGIYRWLARKWFALAGHRISYMVRCPMPGLGEAIYRQMSPETFDLRQDWRGRPVKRWTLNLHLNGEPQPAAWARFVRGATEDWHMDKLIVSARYRGTGLDKALLHQADAILWRNGASRETCG
jgi:GNAT superfamily N-acetyltransferase